MATPGSWIGKTPVPKEETLDQQIASLERIVAMKNHPAGRGISQSYQESSEVSESTDHTRWNRKPSKTRTSNSTKKKNSESSREYSSETKHAIHQNKATGKFWCECEGFQSFDERDANYHMQQHYPVQSKKPYIRKEHLTDRPLANHEALKALRGTLPEAEKYNPGKKPRNKENN